MSAKMKATNGLTKEKSSENPQDKSMKSGFSFDAEPILLVHMMTSLMVIMVLSNLLMEKACSVNLGYSSEVCKAIITKNEDAVKYVEEEKQIHKFVGSVMVWRTILENIFPMVLVLLIGAWSDKYGRKLPMLFVLVGYFVQNIALILCVYFKYTTGAWTVAIVSSVIPGITGNQAAFGMSVFSYISDTTSEEKRSVRNGIAHTSMFLGLTLGLAAGGIASHLKFGFIQVFTAATIIEGLVFLYVWFVIKNTRDENVVKEKTTADMMKDLFDTRHAKDTFSSVFKKRPGYTRMTLWILLISHVCILAPMMGEMGAFGLFGRYKFGWDGRDVAFFMTYRIILGFLGNFISMGILGKVLKMSDPAIGIACCVSGLLGSIVFATANSTFGIYLGPVISILSSAGIIVPRSIISKIIPANEMGKIGSFMACADSITPLLSAPLYTTIYMKTFETFAGAMFLLSTFIMLPPILSFLWIRSTDKKEMKKE